MEVSKLDQHFINILRRKWEEHGISKKDYFKTLSIISPIKLLCTAKEFDKTYVVDYFNEGTSYYVIESTKQTYLHSNRHIVIDNKGTRHTLSDDFVENNFIILTNKHKYYEILDNLEYLPKDNNNKYSYISNCKLI